MGVASSATLSTGGGGEGPGFAPARSWAAATVSSDRPVAEAWAVYEVEDHALEPRVALKAMRGQGWRDAREAARLKREVLLARKVAHLGICRIDDLGTTETARCSCRFWFCRS
jgi:hypothetical protein